MKTVKEYLSTPEGVKQMWDKINEVLDNFNFNKVKRTMYTLDWSWTCSSEEAEMYEEQGCKVIWNKDGERSYCSYYPECQQLTKRAREMLVQCIEEMPEDKTEWSMSTGGFRAKAFIYTDEERADYYGEEVANVDDFAHSVDISLYFIVEESTSY